MIKDGGFVKPLTERLGDEVVALQTRVAELRDALKRSIDDRTVLEQQLRSNEQGAAALRSEVEGLRHDLARARGDRDHLLTERAEVTALLTRRSNQLTNVEQRLFLMREEVERLADQRDALRERLEATRPTVDASYLTPTQAAEAIRQATSLAEARELAVRYLRQGHDEGRCAAEKERPEPALVTAAPIVVPAGAVLVLRSSEKLTTEVAEQLKRRWEESTGGSHRAVVLDPGVRFIAVLEPKKEEKP
jgi:chaperonin cofactor prefoldin